MGLYARYLLPRIVDFVCSTSAHTRQREKVVPQVSGQVLEIGFGSGLNLSLYDPEKVDQVWGLDPSREMWSLVKNKCHRLPFKFNYIAASAESVPLADNSIDTALVTFSLCTIPDVDSALRDIHRVLRPGGRLFFCEHGLAPDERIRKWQHKMDPIWSRVGGGCHLNRNIPQLIRSAGFGIEVLKEMYTPGWKPAAYQYFGFTAPK